MGALYVPPPVAATGTTTTGRHLSIVVGVGKLAALIQHEQFGNLFAAIRMPERGSKRADIHGALLPTWDKSAPWEFAWGILREPSVWMGIGVVFALGLVRF